MKQIHSFLIPQGRGLMETILGLYSSTTIFRFYLLALIMVGSTTIVKVSMCYLHLYLKQRFHSLL